MDLNTIGKTLATARYEMHLLSPDGFPLYAREGETGPELTVDETDRPVIWEIVGQDSAEFRRAKAAIFSWSQQNRGKKLKFKESEQKQFETVAAGVTGWRNMVLTRGEWLDFSFDNLLKVFETYQPAFEQANEAITDRGNFFRSA